MFRFHKRHLKQVRADKKHNGDGDRVGGTGLRFCSNAVGLPALARDVATPGARTHGDNWLLNHPGQTMESAVHDRTRWASSKRKSKVKRATIAWRCEAADE